MQITPDLIKYLESLARITLDEDEEKKVGKELQDILTYIDKLKEVISPFVQILSLTATGTPASGEVASPSSISFCAFCAFSSASS